MMSQISFNNYSKKRWTRNRKSKVTEKKNKFRIFFLIALYIIIQTNLASKYYDTIYWPIILISIVMKINLRENQEEFFKTDNKLWRDSPCTLQYVCPNIPIDRT